MLGRNQRKGYRVVDRSLQYRFLAIIIVYSFVIVLFLAVFMFVPDIVRLQDESLSFHARAAAADKMLIHRPFAPLPADLCAGARWRSEFKGKDKEEGLSPRG
jgi:hypothetical protein